MFSSPVFFAFSAAMRETSIVRDEFIDALKANEAAYGLELGQPQIDRLSTYYDLIQAHNPLLHLVGPCSAEEFATRHILESLTLLKHLTKGATFADVGTGAGLPSIPCLLVRDDLHGLLIESNQKKAAYLHEAVDTLGLSGRAEVVNKQFAEADAGNAVVVTSRALDKFTERLPALLRWAKGRDVVLFGGENVAEKLTTMKRTFSTELLPLSERRFLFAVEKEATSRRLAG